MRRRLEPELLDILPADDPAAIASRHDLSRINWVMRQHAIMAEALKDFPCPHAILDLGGGDGRFLLGVAQHLPHWRGVAAVIADRQDLVTEPTRSAFEKLEWHCSVRRGDVFDAFQDVRDNVLVVANLFLHHLDEPTLKNLFARIASKASGLVACEPRRNRWALLASHSVFALGCNAITRHDAVASVWAGFVCQELSAHWPSGWRTSERPALPFSHLFTARRYAV
jgi:hypothetical protein